MTYAVDFVINVMKQLSSSEPILFQRDRSLYVASAEGFGQVTYGLRTTPEEIRSWGTREQSPDIAESEDIILRWIEGERNRRPAFKRDEEPYLKAILFGPDTTRFTLEDITRTVKQLAGLPDDGKVRMILHGSGYHSHKYGYANDGIDVWVQEARVIDRNRYLELIREREDRLIEEMEQISEVTDRRYVSEVYEKLKIPDCVIFTPYLKISLPRSGKLHLDRREPDSWTQNTEIESHYVGSTKGSILYHYDTDTCRESPFAVHITLNAINLVGVNEEGLKLSRDDLAAKITEQLSAVTSNMSIAQEFIDRINAIHNNVCARNIEFIKDLRIKRIA